MKIDMKIKIITGGAVLIIILGGFLLVSKSRRQTAGTPVVDPNAPACRLGQDCAGGTPEVAAGFASLTGAQLAAMLKQKDFFFVNVHLPYEGEIKNTDAFIPYDKIADNLDKLPKDKNAKIVFYCRSGRMSEIAAQEIVRLGYTNVSHLAGGMIDWEKSGYEIIKK